METKQSYVNEVLQLDWWQSEFTIGSINDGNISVVDYRNSLVQIKLETIW